MTNRDSDLRKISIPSENFTIPAINSFDRYQTSFRFESHTDGSVDALRKILRRLSRMELPGKEHVEGYLRHMTRGNRDKTSLDIFWLRDKSLADLDNLPDPDVLANDIIENLEAAVASFKEIAQRI
jgi:hypothetical protein